MEEFREFLFNIRWKEYAGLLPYSVPYKFYSKKSLCYIIVKK